MKDLFLLIFTALLLACGMLGGISQIMPDEVIDTRIPEEYFELQKKQLHLSP